MMLELQELHPGVVPVEYNILIMPEEAVRRTAGGIILPDSTAETAAIGTMRGRLVALGYKAGDAIWPEAGMERPKPGDIVLFAKYAGTLFTGNDGLEYRVCKDKDIIGIIEQGNDNG